MNNEDRVTLQNFRTMGTLTQSQAIEYYRLLSLEEKESIEVKTEVFPEKIEIKEPEMKKKKK